MKKLLLAVCIVILTGCTRVKSDVLVMAVIPNEDAETCKMMYKPFAEYMTDCLNRPFEIKTVSDYTATIEAMKYGHAQLGRLGAYSYVLGVDSGAEIEAVVYAISAETGEQVYYSVIFVRADSDIYDVSQLEGGSLAYIDPGSTSGYLIPHNHLEEQNIIPENVLFSGGYDASFNAVRNGTVDAATSTLARVGMAEELGIIEEGEMRIIWQSEPIPNPPIAVVSSLDPKEKTQIIECLCNIPPEMIEAWKFGWSGLAKCSDEEFDGIRKAAGLVIPNRD